MKADEGLTCQDSRRGASKLTQWPGTRGQQGHRHSLVKTPPLFQRLLVLLLLLKGVQAPETARMWTRGDNAHLVVCRTRVDTISQIASSANATPKLFVLGEPTSPATYCLRPDSNQHFCRTRYRSPLGLPLSAFWLPGREVRACLPLSHKKKSEIGAGAVRAMGEIVV